MAGLGEVCTHIAATLFYLETVTRIQGKQTCTQTKCEWLIPAYYKNVEYKQVKDIDFTSAEGKKESSMKCWRKVLRQTLKIVKRAYQV